MRRLLLFAALALLAAAPSPLVVGAVRDQYGAPIAGATVRAGTVTASTDAAGTFALHAAAARITIACDYCEPLTISVQPDRAVAAIVTRYAALLQMSPSERDAAYVPYAQLPELVSLTPFTVLNNSKNLLPGPRVSDRGLSAQGSLLIDDGIPNYDIAAGESPYYTQPAYDVQSASIDDFAPAFRYGDQAGGGIVTSSTQPSTASGIVTAGSQAAVNGSASMPDGFLNLAGSRTANDLRARAGASTGFEAGSGDLNATVLAASDDATSSGTLRNALTAARLSYAQDGDAAVQAALYADRAGYVAQFAAPGETQGRWSDLGLNAGWHSKGTVQPFADAGYSLSSGYYDTSSAYVPDVAGIVTQTRADAGLRFTSDRASVTAGAGAFDVAYNGGASGARTPLHAQIVLPSFDASYAFSAHWSLDAQAAGTFRLPSLLEAYGYEPEAGALDVDRVSAAQATLTYGDLRRVRLCATYAAQRVSVLDSGVVHAAGVCAAWQIAPRLALRAWYLHFNDTTRAEEPVLRFGPDPQPASVGSAWLTYELPGGMRVDAIYRRDLIGYVPDPHFDASLSAPLSESVRWFAATERRNGVRYVTAGLRFGP